MPGRTTARAASLGVLTAFLLAVPALMIASGALVAQTRGFGPQADLRYARPTLKWEVWNPGGAPVTAAEMRVNGQRVPARYDTEDRALVYTPPAPLSPGSHKVECRVTFAGTATFSRRWETRVTSNALSKLPAPDAVQLQALQVANECRRELGLPLFGIDDRLNAAADAHAEYMDRHGLCTHRQEPDEAGFVGATHSDRLAAFGWGGNSWEGVASGDRSVTAAVRGLFDAPFHRLPFMQPGPVSFGAGRQGRSTATLYSGSPEVATVVSPADGQRGVPASWDGVESPDPMRGQGDGGPVGYPIVFARFDPSTRSIRVDSASLTDASGSPVPCVLSTPADTPQLDTAAILVPKRPLTPGATYKVTVRARDDRGRSVGKTWTFTTGR